MLWTDSVFITPDDLSRLDSEVAAVATANDITLTGNNGLLRGAIEEVSNEMMKLVIAFGGYLNSGDLSANHMAAVLNVGIGNSVRQKVSLQQIIVSADVSGQWGWVKQWAIFWALKTFYRDAFSRLGGDRYKTKMDFYKDELQRRIMPNMWALGVPITLRPLSRPAALFERATGTWDSTNVALEVGSGTLDGVSCDVVVTYCDMSQANLYVSPDVPNNAESDASDTITIAMTAGNVIGVDISSLRPPTGTQHPSQVMVVVVAPLKATHWNVYAGPTGGTLYLQNLAPIPIATTSFALPGDPVVSDYPLGNGQYAERRLSLVPTRQRA
jgi:hypothetical protein